LSEHLAKSFAASAEADIELTGSSIAEFTWLCLFFYFSLRLVTKKHTDRHFCTVGGIMTLRMKGGWVLSGIIALCALVVSVGDAQAGGIVAKSGKTSQIGDPMFDYDFQIDLLAHSTLSNGGFITVYDIPFLEGPPLTSQPSLWGELAQDIGITPLNTPPHTDDPTVPNITWIYNGTAINNNTDNDLVLGTFVVGRTGELASAPSPTLLFIGSLDGTDYSNMGFVEVNAVPEPSSVALLLVGVSTLPLIWLRNKRRATRLSRVADRLA
jgi:hypothetical protein